MATETLRPVGDIALGNWTTQAGGTSNLYQTLDETSQSDSDYVRSGLNPVNDVYECVLTDKTLIFATGEVGIVVGKESDNATEIDIKVQLLQGTTEIASWTYDNVAFGFTLHTETLTAPQIALLGDDLRLRYTANPAGAIFTFRGSFDEEAGATTTSRNVDIGAASADRLVIVAIGTQNFNGASAVTVNGVSLTKIVDHTITDFPAGTIWAGVVSSGSGSVSVETTFGWGGYRGGSVYTITGLSSTTAKATRTSNGTISVDAGDFWVAGGYRSGASQPDWSESTQVPTVRTGTPIYAGVWATGDMTILATNASFSCQDNNSNIYAVATWA